MIEMPPTNDSIIVERFWLKQVNAFGETLERKQQTMFRNNFKNKVRYTFYNRLEKPREQLIRSLRSLSLA